MVEMIDVCADGFFFLTADLCDIIVEQLLNFPKEINDVSIYLNISISAGMTSGGASVHSSSSSLVNTPTSIAQPTSTQTTAFVQPTQQQAANQDAGPSMEAERPTASSSLIGSGKHGQQHLSRYQ